MNWFDRHPHDLVARSGVDDAIAAVRTTKHLSASQATVLDIVLADWVGVALARGIDVESLAELQRLCQFAIRRVQNESDTAQFASRWGALFDVLEGQRGALSRRAVTAPPPLAQQAEITALLQQRGEMTQRQLAEQLKLSDGRVSQLMRALEARSVVQRSRKGRESMVRLARQPVQERSTVGPRRTGSVMSLFVPERLAA